MAQRIISVILLIIIITAATVQAKKEENYKLEKILILSRHNVRAPLSESIKEITPHKWYEWKEKAGELSQKGGLLETALGQYFNKYLVNEGFMRQNYIPEEGEFRFYANSFQRTIATAQYFASGILPVGNVKIEHKYGVNESDPTFLSTLEIEKTTEEYKRRAAEEYEKMGGEKNLGEKLRFESELVAKVIDLKESEAAKKKGLNKFTAEDFKMEKHYIVKGKLRNAMAASDALVLQYYEQGNSLKAAFGHKLSAADWKRIAGVDYFGINALYELPTLSTVLSRPLLEVMRDELELKNRRFTFLCGHDINIATVLSALGVENYTAPNSIESKTPIGVKIVIEKRRGKDGREYAAVNLVYQSTQQILNVETLSLENPPMILPLKFKNLQMNEDGLYLFSDFEKLLNSTIDKYELLIKK